MQSAGGGGSIDRTVLWLLIAALLLVGVAIADDYGISWDEPDSSAYARQTLEAFRTLKAPMEWHGNLELVGPFYVSLAEAVSNAAVTLGGPGLEVSARHFAYFLSFIVACMAIYSLARRIAGTWAAIGSAGLFATQPLIFGHAFINPKDIPFMAFFLLTMAAGLWMVESMVSSPPRRPSWVTAAVVCGAILGVTTSIRLFGPFAGLLVSALALFRLRSRAPGPLAVYWISAAASSFVTWPYLWPSPFQRLVENLRITFDVMSFPWDNIVLYRGLLYPLKDLPWHYLPFITLIQLTEPAILLALTGGLVGLFLFARDPARRPLLMIFFLWSAVPYASAVLLHSATYDNSRHFLFAIPPFFLAAALAFDWLMGLIRVPALRAAVVVLAILPGAMGILRLHPYEYIYYNQIVGGVPGAYRQYELDYWGTAYREAMIDLNEVAPPGAVVEIAGPWLSAAYFARDDMQVFKSGADRTAGSPAAMFLMLLTRSNMDVDRFPEARNVVEVRVEGATLAVVRSLGDTP